MDDLLFTVTGIIRDSRSHYDTIFAFSSTKHCRRCPNISLQVSSQSGFNLLWFLKNAMKKQLELHNSKFLLLSQRKTPAENADAKKAVVIFCKDSQLTANAAGLFALAKAAVGIK